MTRQIRKTGFLSGFPVGPRNRVLPVFRMTGIRTAAKGGIHD